MVLLSDDPNVRLPTSEELPCSDETPVDNERQNDIPNWLKASLQLLWGAQKQWFFGVDMGIYDRQRQLSRVPIIPDGFLSLGVKRHRREGGRLSYVITEENGIVPILVLEYVSQNYGGEYDEKMDDYARLGVLYYVIYNPQHHRRDRHDPFELYRLEADTYERVPGDPVWMPELDLGIGRVQGTLEGIRQEWLAWFDQQGQSYDLPEEIITKLQRRQVRTKRQLERERQRAEQERQRAEQERQRAERLADYLRSQGIDPDNLP